PAQTLYGSLTGNVSDASGAVLPNAHIEALDVGTGNAKQAATDSRGAYLLSDLQPGTYKVTVSAPSFATRIYSGVAVTLNNILRLVVTLSVTQLNDSITVSASEVTLQTDRADVSHQISAVQITDLPLINSQGRNFQEIYK